MIEIKSVPLDSYQAEIILELLRSEWPELVKFESSLYGVNLPNPLAAYKKGELIGGLSFSAFKAPKKLEPGLWINAVYVKSTYRRLGIATALVKHAQSGLPCIYALTKFPSLYFNLGFKAVEQGPEGVVVKYTET